MPTISRTSTTSGGYVTGDEVLAEWGWRIGACCSPSDTVAASGAMVLHHRGAGRVRSAHRCSGRPSDRCTDGTGRVVAGRVVPALQRRHHHRRRWNRVDGTELLRQADFAMRAAKRHRSGQVELFQSATDAALMERIWLAQELPRALERREFRAALPAERRAAGRRDPRVRGTRALAAPAPRVAGPRPLHPPSRRITASSRSLAHGCWVRPRASWRSGSG